MFNKIKTFGKFMMDSLRNAKNKISPKFTEHASYQLLQAQIAKFPINPAMRRMLIYMFILFGAIFGYQTFKHFMIKKYIGAMGNPSVTVSTTKVQFSPWQDKIVAAASLRAVNGVNVTTELAGIVRNIAFRPGDFVKKDDVLVELNVDTDVAKLKVLEASAGLAKTIYERDKAQFAIKAISKAQLDTDAANLKAKNEEAIAQATIIAKKIIKAPFTGKLGVSQINVGQFINAGGPIVTLQQLSPIYVDFFLPQQDLSKVQLGQKLILKTDTYPNQTFIGEITTINPIVDPDTRNIQIEATIQNEDNKLLPGMFGEATLDIDQPINYLTLPQTAISYNPYGDIVYIVNPSKEKDSKGNPVLIATQHFVKVGSTRGDQVSILSGIKEGDIIVTSGQLKLKNGSKVIINNSVVPSNSPNPVFKNNQ